MDTFRHLYVIPLRLCPHGIRRVEKNVAVIIFLDAVHPPAQSVPFLAVEPPSAPESSRETRPPLYPGCPGTEERVRNLIGLALPELLMGAFVAQRGTRVPVLPAPVPFVVQSSPPPEHNILPHAHRTPAFQPSEHHRRLLHLDEGTGLHCPSVPCPVYKPESPFSDEQSPVRMSPPKHSRPEAPARKEHPRFPAPSLFSDSPSFFQHPEHPLPASGSR